MPKATGLPPGLYHIAIPRNSMGSEPSIDAATKIRPISEEEAKSLTEVFRRINRNEGCPCGSGKKYKRCCLQKDFPYG